MTQTTKTVQSTITNPVSFLDSEVTAKEYVKDGGAARKAYRDAIQVENTDRQAFRGVSMKLNCDVRTMLRWAHRNQRWARWEHHESVHHSKCAHCI